MSINSVLTSKQAICVSSTRLST